MSKKILFSHWKNRESPYIEVNTVRQEGCYGLVMLLGWIKVKVVQKFWRRNLLKNSYFEERKEMGKCLEGVMGKYL
jgi:hypothetical protein